MTREIKFRAWDEKGKQMIPHDPLIMNCDGFFAVDEEGDEFAMTEIMQFTGLHDKNGKEIYEGDIVVKHCIFPKYDRISIVQWERPDTRSGTWELATVKFSNHEDTTKDKILDPVYYEPFGLGCDPQNHEIIGNIHENPELINK